MAVQLQRRYRLGEFEVEPGKCLLLRHDEQVRKQVPLPELPFKVLLYLIEERDRVVERRELIERFWEGKDSYEEALTKCVSTIRTHLNDSSNSPRYIETRKKVGYRFVGPVEELTAESGPVALEIERVRATHIIINEDDGPEIIPAALLPGEGGRRNNCPTGAPRARAASG